MVNIQLTKEAEQFVRAKDNIYFRDCDVRKGHDLNTLVQRSGDIWNVVLDV